MSKFVRAADRLGPLRKQWGEQLIDLASLIDSMGRAMIEADEILGAISGAGIANHLAGLPQHIREVFLEHASDEAAAGIKADQRYFAEMAPESKEGALDA